MAGVSAVRFPHSWSDLNVVLGHDWLVGMRGGERVVELLCAGFPRAPMYTLVHDPASVSAVINAHPIHTPPAARFIPMFASHYRYLLPVLPALVETLKVPEADLILSTSHCVVKGIKPVGRTRHLCYCFTPMRYAWLFYSEYFGTSGLKKSVLTRILARLRDWDRRTSDRVDRFVAISQHVRARIRDFYGRDADVVYPPVNTSYWTPAHSPPGNYDLLVSALVPYKRVDLAVRAYQRTDRRLLVVGTGPQARELRRIASSNVSFLGWRTDNEILGLYRGCRLLVFPGEEDFGIVPVEAQACGRPVVAYARGGALETVREGETGLFFKQQTEEALVDAVEKCAAVDWDPNVIRINAERFSAERFISDLSASISECLQTRQAER